MTEPRVAVVIPAYNAEPWLGEAIESVLRQRLWHEIIVVDDGSSDATAQTADRYGPAVRLLRQRHAGVGAARNRGVAATHADIVAFLDADDRFTSAGLDLRVEFHVAHPACELVFGQLQSFYTTHDGEPVPRGPLYPGVVVGAATVRRSALERVGQFNNARVGEGLDWQLRAHELGVPAITLPDHVIWRRVHGDNATIRHQADYREYARALKASLDRRRARPTTWPASQ
ncbi:MAG TPA: glycosyltransferase family A protein [Solirubrobacteraceae bacterium]|nr:glycosyltransferase family A protein [Solirubrobacteraceae bacterium]